MAADPNNTTIINMNNSNSLTMVTFPTNLKLTSNNYLGWKTQVEALLHGLDLYKFIDGTHPAPLPTKATDGTEVQHKDFAKWFRQDRLLFGAIVGSLSPAIIPLVTNASSSLEAWNILLHTYASPSRGHIKQLQHRLKQRSKKQNQTITDYMQEIKTLVDELALLGKKLDAEDITDSILAGLDSITYKPILDAVHARDNPISFNELHEKLVNHELSLAQIVTASNIHQPVTAFVAQNRSPGRPWTPRQSPRPFSSPAGSLPKPNPNGYTSQGSRPYLGKCQWCYTKGHSLSNCHAFKKVNPNINVPVFNRSTYAHHPQAYTMGTQEPNTVNWLFDSGASHHVTNDLRNLSLHAPYDGNDELMVGDDSCLSISHTGSQNEPNSPQGTRK